MSDPTTADDSRVLSVGLIPDTGRFTLSAWAIMFGVDLQTVRKWFDEIDLPYERWGKERVYHAADVTRPKITKSTDPEYRKHGGPRSKRKA